MFDEEEEEREVSAPPATLYVSRDGKTCISGEALEEKEAVILDDFSNDFDSTETTFDGDEFVLVRQDDVRKPEEKEAEEAEEVNAVIERAAASKQSEEKVVERQAEKDIDENKSEVKKKKKEKKEDGGKRIVVRVRMDLADTHTEAEEDAGEVGEEVEVVPQEQHQSEQLLMARQSSSFEIKEIQEEKLVATSPCGARRVAVGTHGKGQNSGYKCVFGLLETKLTMSLGQLLLILLSNCVLTVFSYGFILQCSYSANMDPSHSFPLSSTRMSVETNAVEVASVSGKVNSKNDLDMDSHLTEDEFLRAHSLLKCKCVCRPLLYSSQDNHDERPQPSQHHRSYNDPPPGRPRHHHALDGLAFAEEGNSSESTIHHMPSLPQHQQQQQPLEYLVAWPTVRMDNYQGLHEMKCTIR